MMGFYRVQHSPVGIAIYIAVLVVCSVTVSEISAQIRRKHKEHYGNLTEVSQSHNRDPKFLFGFVTLPPTTCMTDDKRVGTCLTSKTCTRQGGTAMGSCGMKFGACCIINKMCNGNGTTDTVTQNGTHLVGPSMFSQICKYEIPRQPGVCQIKLDFNNFKIQGPTRSTMNDAEFMLNAGNCETDSFTLSGFSNAVLGQLCGDLSGQHMYLDYGSNDKISLDFFLMQNPALQQWDITVTMIRCDSTEKAPPGCLQYFTTQSAVVRSFNYNDQQLNNQDYSVCVRANVGMRKITWKACALTDTSTDFAISGPGPFLGNPAFGNPISGDLCITDWVMLLGDNKRCGSQFPDMVSTTAQPFILNVHFNNYEMLVPPPSPPNPPANPNDYFDTDNIGFCLKYSQSPVFN